MSSMPLWGGIECTVNRVGDAWLNQMALTGHLQRIADLDRIADLGIRTLRYPILWELHQHSKDGPIDWAWADARLARLSALHISPIVGLVHHGSGPGFTDLLSSGFAPGLARFARSVAERYPWVDSYTPVNEPLTTARFSGLYGHWYPHHRDDCSFARALINQCRAIVLSMREIRRVNPRARLVQTEDLGKSYSTPHMRYQADFDNERRWLTWDLLAGKIDQQHSMRSFLLESGVSESELDWFRRHACPADIVGINHYVTSDRFLDERLARYPAQFHGANDHDAFADLEAVRVLPASRSSWQRVIEETAQRYHAPLALTEVHLGCTREDQLRWFHEAWQAAEWATALGYEVCGVTAWALFGSVGWNTLLTGGTDQYETGAFDVRGPEPRETAVAKMIRELTRGNSSPPVFGTSGWWRRKSRVLYADEESHCDIINISEAGNGLHGAERRRPRDLKRTPCSRPLLITGGGGSIGRAFARGCELRAIPYVRLSRAELDICDPSAVEAGLSALRPWAVVNAAGFSNIDRAEAEKDRCLFANGVGPRTLAAQLQLREIPWATFSSAHVYDGRQAVPYREDAPHAPLNAYGKIQSEIDLVLQREHPGVLLVRTGRCFEPHGECGWLGRALHALAEGRHYCALADVMESHTFVPDLVDACLDLLIDGATGAWHLANRGGCSSAELIIRAAGLLDIDTQLLERCTRSDPRVVAQRAPYLMLDSGRGIALPPLASGIDRYAEAVRPRFHTTPLSHAAAHLA